MRAMKHRRVAVLSALAALAVAVAAISMAYLDPPPTYRALPVPAGTSFTLANVLSYSGFEVYWAGLQYTLNASHVGFIQGAWVATAGTYVEEGGATLPFAFHCQLGGCFQGSGELNGTLDGLLLGWNEQYSYTINGTPVTARDCAYYANGTPEPPTDMPWQIVFLSRTPGTVVTVTQTIDVQEVPASPCSAIT